MEKCPTCAARLKGGDVCRRCKTDVKALIRIEQKSREHLKTAEACFEKGDYGDAFVHARRSLSLHRSDRSRRLCAAAALLTHRFDIALKLWCEHVQGGPATSDPFMRE